MQLNPPSAPFAPAPVEPPKVPVTMQASISVAGSTRNLSSMDMLIDAPLPSAVDPNVSIVRPPPPDAMKRPPPAPETYYVVTAGEKVGIFSHANDLGATRLPLLPYFYMTKFDNWDAALQFYAEKYAAKEVYLVSNGEARTLQSTRPDTISRPLGSTSGSTNGLINAPTGTSTIHVGTTANIAVAPVQPIIAVSATGTGAPSIPAPAPLVTASSILSRLLTEPQPNVHDRDPYAGILNSPFGRRNHPIMVSSTFPTPEKVKESVAVGRYRRAILDARKSPSSGRSTLAKAIMAARKAPSAGRSSKAKGSVLGQKSGATTRVRRRSKGKGKGKHILAYEDTEDGEIIPGPSYSKSSRLGFHPRIEPLVYNNEEAHEPMGASSSVPIVTITAPTPAAPVVNATPATRYNPFLHSPFNLPKNPILATPPRISKATVINSPASFEQLIEDAAKTPKSAGSQRRLAIIERVFEELNTPKATNHPTPGLSSPAPHYDTPVSSPFKATASTQSEIIGAASPINPALSSVHSSPETEYGLSSDLDADFLDQAAPLLDQVYPRPAF